MIISKTLNHTLSLKKTKALLFALLLALMILMPALVHLQWITGPTVNAALFIATVIIGPMAGIMLGLMPSAIALGAGLLPIPLAPMVPFIMIGNALLVITFFYLFKRNYFAALGTAAFVKFLFLHQSVTWVMTRLVEGKIVSQLAIMMSWPQFFTALIGGIVAYAFLKPLKKV